MAMMTDDSKFPGLFAHKLRADWGVAVLASEIEGKRRYLFENGEERTLAGDYLGMMRKVEKPSADQQAVYARLRSALAKRDHEHAVAPAAMQIVFTFSDQLARLHLAYPAGLSDPKWVAETRGEAAEIRAPRHRLAAIRDAQEKLSREALDGLVKGQRFGEVWERVIAVLRATDLVLPARLRLPAAREEQQRNLALAIRELLHGRGAFGARFDHYLAAFGAAFDQPPGWELATAPCGLVHATEHVCVDPIGFRKQLKASGSRRSIPAQPTSTGYAACLGIARLVAHKLADQGEIPRDLLEVRDFITLTLKRWPKGRVNH